MIRTPHLLAASLLSFSILAPNIASAQSASTTEPAKHTSDARPDTSTFITKTYYLANAVEQNDANEVLVDLRNMLPPWVKIYLVSSQSAITLYAPPAEHTLAQQIIRDIDRPKKTYRLTYTLTEMDGNKRVGNQHYSLVAVAGQRTTLKEGDRIPISTGLSGTGVVSQITYYDIGTNFSAVLNSYAGGVRLQSKVEQNSVEEHADAGSNHPVTRQTVLEGTAMVPEGKPIMLGSVDIPGTTHRYDISVALEVVQ